MIWHKIETKSIQRQIFTYEPPHDKTNKVTVRPAKTQIRLGKRPPSLIRVFAVRMKKDWVLRNTLSAQRRLIRLGGCPGWSESSQGAQSFCWFCHEAAHISISTQYRSYRKKNNYWDNLRIDNSIIEKCVLEKPNNNIDASVADIRFP